jgi:hypothetical protein
LDEWSFGERRSRPSITSPRKIIVIRGVISEIRSQATLPFGVNVRFWIPSSVEVICELCFDFCRSLESVTFATNSRSSRLEKKAFCKTHLRSIHLPGSIEVICESCFFSCKSLTSISFDYIPRLQRIEKSAFASIASVSLIIPGCVRFFPGPALVDTLVQTFSFSEISTTYSICESLLQHLCGRSLIRCFRSEKHILIGSAVEVICESCFSSCHSLESVTFAANSRLSRLEKEAFCKSGL